MKVPLVPLEAWRSLYESALHFKELRPWESLHDSDVFGVLDPGTGRTGYCSVFGALGQMLALCVYRGSEGIGILRRMREAHLTKDIDEWAAAQFCLMGEFEDRTALKKQDLAVIKALGLKCRGHRAYPVFRSYLPGYCPWFLTEEEAVFLALAFGASIQFIADFRENPDILRGHGEGSCLVYKPEHVAGLPQAWTASWQVPEPLPQAPILFTHVPQEDLHELLSKNLTRTEALELGSFILPNTAITGECRPCYARVLVAVHSQMGIVLSTATIPAYEDSRVALRDLVLAMIRDQRLLPREIRVSDATLAEALRPIAAKLGITSSLHRKLPAVSAVKEAMAGYVRGGH
jgi:hypothetical protein